MQTRGWVPYFADALFIWSSGSVEFNDFNNSRVNARTLYDAGWPCVNHSTTHRALGTLTAAEVTYEMENSRAFWIGKSMRRGIEFYASPQSSTSDIAETTIRDLGFVLQRHARKENVVWTPFGVDNTGHIGSYDMGNKTYAAIKAHIDAVVVNYKQDFFPFFHDVVPGGAVDGSTTTGVSTEIYQTTLMLVLDYLQSLETQGLLTVPSITEWYYG